MAKSLATLLRIQDWNKTIQIIAGGHALLHLTFLAFEIYSSHWYGVVGSVAGIVASGALFWGHRKQIPYLFIPYLMVNFLLIIAWLGAALYLIVQAAEYIPDQRQVHTLLRYQSPAVGIVMGSIELIVSLLQLIPLVLIYEAGNLLRKNGFYE